MQEILNSIKYLVIILIVSFIIGMANYFMNDEMRNAFFIYWGAAFIITSIYTAFAISSVFRERTVPKYHEKEQGPVPVEYLPPKGVSIVATSALGIKAKSLEVAQLTDLVVRKYITLYHINADTPGAKPQYEIEYTGKQDGLRPEEQKILKNIFNSRLQSGMQRVQLSQLKNYVSYVRSWKETMNSASNLQRVGLNLYDSARISGASAKQRGVLFFAIITLSPALFGLYAAMSSLKPVTYELNDDGVALRTYLLGLKKYIQLAEAERIAILQSPEGAERLAVSGYGEGMAAQVVLYERLLPYAILFGYEKEWRSAMSTMPSELSTLDIDYGELTWVIADGLIRIVGEALDN